ncbi:MAG: CNP1-like family protein [Gammaproteobacteria bacterium]|nr:CNP1-like family protein [Gammaproteobacteria bacterium]
MPKSFFLSTPMKPVYAACLGSLALLWLAPAGVTAKDNPLIYEPGKDEQFYEKGVEYQEAGPWKEAKSELPPYPDDGDLIELPEVSARDRFTYFIDKKHLVVSEDKVVHYTIVAESETGARNVFFEGIRCDQGMYKVYGFGSSDGKVSAMRNPSWKYIASRAQRYRRDLYSFFVCDSYGFPLASEHVIERLKTGEAVGGSGRGGLLGGERGGW